MKLKDYQKKYPFLTDKKLIKFIDRFRDQIPERYNQIDLIEQLFNPDIDFLVSISNRTDGKTFNYVNFMFEFCYEFDLGFTLLSRTYMLRQAYQSLLFKITEETGKQLTDILFKRTDDYMMVFYKEKLIGIITDLNNATDLKYHSAFIKDFPIIIYDEFLALEGDYLPDEYDKLKTIYESIDRKGEIPYIGFPKIVLLGNAVNFSSPLLAALDLFNKLETHPLNTSHNYGNIALEMRKNDNANETRNTRAFNSDNDAMTTGQFKVNNFKIVSNNEVDDLKYKGEYFYIKLDNTMYIQVMYDRNDFTNVILSVKTLVEEPYFFCSKLGDKNKEAIFLKETFYSDRQYKKYDKGLYKFENAFSKEYITDNPSINSIKITKCISIHNAMTQPAQLADKKEAILKDRFLEDTKRAILLRMM